MTTGLNGSRSHIVDDLPEELIVERDGAVQAGFAAGAVSMRTPEHRDRLPALLRRAR